MGRLTPIERELVFRLRKQRVPIKDIVLTFHISRVNCLVLEWLFLENYEEYA